MCGRFAFYSPHEAIVRLFGVASAPEIEPRWNIAPTRFIATVRETGGPREVAMLYWGLVPSWAKEKAIGARMINARSETLAEKPSFRNAFRRRRCLVLADGYYEWQRSGAAKQPYFIAFDDGAAVRHGWTVGAMARPGFGRAARVLLRRYHSPPPRRSFTCTTACRRSCRPRRTPSGSIPRNEATDRLARLLQPCQRADLRARPVSSRVNDARHQGADLVRPISRS